jgi:hypothetical protein
MTSSQPQPRRDEGDVALSPDAAALLAGHRNRLEFVQTTLVWCLPESTTMDHRITVLRQLLDDKSFWLWAPGDEEKLGIRRHEFLFGQDGCFPFNHRHLEVPAQYLEGCANEKISCPPSSRCKTMLAHTSFDLRVRVIAWLLFMSPPVRHGREALGFSDWGRWEFHSTVGIYDEMIEEWACLDEHEIELGANFWSLLQEFGHHHPDLEQESDEHLLSDHSGWLCVQRFLLHVDSRSRRVH